MDKKKLKQWIENVTFLVNQAKTKQEMKALGRIISAKEKELSEKTSNIAWPSEWKNFFNY